MENNLTDISYIKKLCEKYGFSLSKNFGQNFIVNAGICPKIVNSSNITKEDGVIEIGTGIGVLTKELSKASKKVVAIEIDERLPSLLEESLADCDNVKVIMGDVLKVDLAQIIKDEFPNTKVSVCANLPYYITSPIIMKLLEDKLPIDSITVMVQKEAAERICAKTGTRKCGAISYAINYYAKATQLFTVSPGSFYPPPKVTSSIIRLDINNAPPVNPMDEKKMFKLIRFAFNQRRKTIVNSLSAGLSLPKTDISTAMENINLSPLLRPEQMTLEDFANLSNELK